MPDDEIRLAIPPDDDLVPVASVAVRAAARQVALPEVEITRLREALVEALAARMPLAGGPLEVILRPGAGRLGIEVDGVTVA